MTEANKAAGLSDLDQADQQPFRRRQAADQPDQRRAPAGPRAGAAGDPHRPARNGFETSRRRCLARSPVSRCTRRSECRVRPWQAGRDPVGRVPGDHLDGLGRQRQPAAPGGRPFGYDQRYAFQALPSVGVDSGVTSVSILTQTARTLATTANVIRAIDAVTAKPETTETLTVAVTPLEAGRLGRVGHSERVHRERPGRLDRRERPPARPHRRARPAARNSGRGLRVPGARDRPPAGLDPQGDVDDHVVRATRRTR